MRALAGILVALFIGGFLANGAFYFAWLSSFPNAAGSYAPLSSVLGILALAAFGYGSYLFFSAMLPGWRRYYEAKTLMEGERARSEYRGGPSEFQPGEVGKGGLR